MVFIDFSIAFKSMNHGIMFTTLRALTIPERIAKTLKGKAKPPGDRDTDYFNIHAGEMQVYMLNPHLFVNRSNRRKRRIRLNYKEKAKYKSFRNFNYIS